MIPDTHKTAWHAAMTMPAAAVAARQPANSARCVDNADDISGFVDVSDPEPGEAAPEHTSNDHAAQLAVARTLEDSHKDVYRGANSLTTQLDPYRASFSGTVPSKRPRSEHTGSWTLMHGKRRQEPASAIDLKQIAEVVTEKPYTPFFFWQRAPTPALKAITAAKRVRRMDGESYADHQSRRLRALWDACEENPATRLAFTPVDEGMAGPGKGDFWKDGVLNTGDRSHHGGIKGGRELDLATVEFLEKEDMYGPMAPMCLAFDGLLLLCCNPDLIFRDVIPNIWNSIMGQFCCCPMMFDTKLQDLLDVNGRTGCRLRSQAERRMFVANARITKDNLVRSLTTHHIGDKKTPSKGTFMKVAQKWRPPSHEEILAEVESNSKSNKPQSDHAYSAVARHLTVSSIRKACASTGQRSWDPNVSSYARDKGVAGVRPVHVVKDLGHDDPRDALRKGDIVTMIDDQGLDLREAQGHHIVLWTSKYPALSGKGIDSVYYYTSPTTVTEVTGDGDGAQHKNQTPMQFNQNDLFYLESTDRRRYSVYQVVIYYQPNVLKQVVFCVCLHTINIPYPIHDLMTMWTEGHRLNSTGINTIGPAENVAINPADPARTHTRDILVMSTGTPKEPMVSLKYMSDIGPDSSITITRGLYTLIRYIQHSGGRGQTISEIQTNLRFHMEAQFGSAIPDTSSAVLAEFMRASADWGELPNVVYLSLKQKGEYPVREVSTATAVNALPPLTDGTNPGVLAKTPAAPEAYLENRLKPNVNNTVPSPEFQKVIDFAVNHFVQGVAKESGIAKGSVMMPTFKEVEESRNGPLQRARRENWGKLGYVPSDDTARVDTKKEVGHKTDDAPRGVCGLPYELGVDSGRLGKGLTKVLSKTKHYNPGDTPDVIAQCVQDMYRLGLEHELLSKKHGVKQKGARAKDYTKMDEMHSEITAAYSRALINYFFHKTIVQEALKIFEKLFHMRTKVGKHVLDSGWKNSSGSGMTTVLNCIVNAVQELITCLVALCQMYDPTLTEREPKPESPPEGTDPANTVASEILAGFTHRLTMKKVRKCINEVQKSAWFSELTTPGNLMEKLYTWIGPKFGDDALDPSTPLISDEAWGIAAEYVQFEIGLQIKLEFSSCILHEEVEYLSRIFPCPLRSLVSYCKIVKAVDKLRIAQNNDVSKYALKLQGYWVTDRHTPIVGALLTAAARIYNIDLPEGLKLRRDLSFMSKLYDVDRDMYFKLSNGAFPACEDEDVDDLRNACAARQLRFTGPELRQYDKALSEQDTLEGVAGYAFPIDPTKVKKVDPPNVTRVAASSGAVWLKMKPEGKPSSSSSPPKPPTRGGSSKRDAKEEESSDGEDDVVSSDMLHTQRNADSSEAHMAWGSYC